MENKADVKKGQTVWVEHRIFRKPEIVETKIKSVGPKFVVTEFNDKIRFDRETLRQVNACGSPSYIILDLEEHKKNSYYQKLRSKIEKFDWKTLSREQLDEVAKMLNIVETEEE